MKDFPAAAATTLKIYQASVLSPSDLAGHRDLLVKAQGFVAGSSGNMEQVDHLLDIQMKITDIVSGFDRGRVVSTWRHILESMAKIAPSSASQPSPVVLDMEQASDVACALVLVLVLACEPDWGPEVEQVLVSLVQPRPSLAATVQLVLQLLVALGHASMLAEVLARVASRDELVLETIQCLCHLGLRDVAADQLSPLLSDISARIRALIRCKRLKDAYLMAVNKHRVVENSAKTEEVRSIRDEAQKEGKKEAQMVRICDAWLKEYA